MWATNETSGTEFGNPALCVAGDQVTTFTGCTGAGGGGGFPVRVKGIASGGGTSFTLWGTMNSASGPYDYVSTFAATPLAASKVDFYKPMTIKWQYAHPSRQKYLDAGRSTNQVYVSLQPPIPGNLYHTVVHLACSKPGATTENQAVANTWSFFTGKAVETWDEQPLHYYEAGVPWANDVTDVGNLLATQNGQCNSWRELLESAWHVNGIVSQGASATSTTSGGFLVKKWAFGTPTLGVPPYDYYLELNNPDGSMVPSTSGDVQEQSGIAGQNSPSPAERVFGVHYFQLWNNLYYDPSYGVNYTDAADFQSKAIAGYVISTASRTPGKPAVAAKPVTGIIEIQIVP
jgi:hypothetical protein